ncbi:class Ib ribonucleoside-diphosphate reductase assembly flavoprotein NrdI [Streptomyces griseofuscus]|uniref:class Ib ribonucleoside-diphosphate reductase assembly flavoprotein NrdI n=1 Tax=Streptomyces griseofuscus TaxID=146922 RepID=UPI00371B6B45
MISSGNTNFGADHCLAGRVIAAKCRVPELYRFELPGTGRTADILDTTGIGGGVAGGMNERTRAAHRHGRHDPAGQGGARLPLRPQVPARPGEADTGRPAGAAGVHVRPAGGPARREFTYALPEAWHRHPCLRPRRRSVGGACDLSAVCRCGLRPWAGRRRSP